jgi:hypothetical protein
LQRSERRAPFAGARSGLSPARASPALRRRVEFAVGLGVRAARYAPGEQLGKGLYVLKVVSGDGVLPGAFFRPRNSILLEARQWAAPSLQVCDSAYCGATSHVMMKSYRKTPFHILKYAVCIK